MITICFLPFGCASKSAIPSTTPVVHERGLVLFQSYCATCHLPDGAGLAGNIPPLAGSPWVSGSEDRIVRIVLDGLRGPIEVNGQKYEVEMLGFRPILSDEEIAAILTYVRHEFGQGSSPVSALRVALVRSQTQHRGEYWTVAELLAIP